MVAEPAEGAHRLREADRGEQERQSQPGRVEREQHCPLQDRARARDREDRGEHRADARRRADRERCAEQDARVSPARSRQQARGEEPLRPGQKPDERQPDDDEDQAGELELAVGRQDASDRGRCDPEDDEDDREAEDERQAGERDPARGSGRSEPVGLDRRHGRQVARHEREDAGRDDRDDAREEGCGDLAGQRVSPRRSGRALRRRGARARGSAERPAAPAHACGSSATRADRGRARLRTARRTAGARQAG